MDDSNNTTQAAAAVPAWQRRTDAADREKDEEEDEEASKTSKPFVQSEKIGIARRFLEHDDVKSASREKKVAFLRSKGINDEDVEKALGLSASAQDNRETGVDDASPSLLAPAKDRPPVVTYPEFLIKSERPPPLVTKDRLVNTLYAFAGLSTLLYGVSKYVVAPMVDSLTEARAELHDVTGKQLGNLVAQLEKTVSVIPNDASSSSAAREDGEVSDAEDPTEMFHRDVGTQTSFIDSTSPSTRDTEPSSQKQVDTLNALTKSLCVLRDQLRGQGEGFEDIRVLLDVLRDDLDGLTYGGNEPISVHDGYPHSGKNEQEDEIRKVRDNIRRVKGSLLSSRSFPGSMR